MRKVKQAVRGPPQQCQAVKIFRCLVVAALSQPLQTEDHRFKSKASTHLEMLQQEQEVWLCSKWRSPGLLPWWAPNLGSFEEAFIIHRLYKSHPMALLFGVTHTSQLGAAPFIPPASSHLSHDSFTETIIASLSKLPENTKNLRKPEEVRTNISSSCQHINK